MGACMCVCARPCCAATRLPNPTSIIQTRGDRLPWQALRHHVTSAPLPSSPLGLVQGCAFLCRGFGALHTTGSRHFPDLKKCCTACPVHFAREGAKGVAIVYKGDQEGEDARETVSRWGCHPQLQPSAPTPAAASPSVASHL